MINKLRLKLSKFLLWLESLVRVKDNTEEDYVVIIREQSNLFTENEHIARLRGRSKFFTGQSKIYSLPACWYRHSTTYIPKDFNGDRSDCFEAKYNDPFFTSKIQ